MPLGKPLLDVLDRMHYGGIVLDEAAKVLRINDTARRFLAQHKPGSPRSNADWECLALMRLLRPIGSCRLTLDEDAWLVVRSGREQSRPLIARAVPIHERAASGARTVLVLIDLAVLPQPRPEALQKIFGLTPTEARLAVEIAIGKSPEQIAEAGEIS